MVNLTINGRAVSIPEGQTVLDAARQAGITIPTLCDHPDLTPLGGCRLCLVEVQGLRLPIASCTLLASEGMNVQTETPKLIDARQTVLRLLLSNYYAEHYNIESDGRTNELLYWAEQYDVDPQEYALQAPRCAIDSDPNPFVHVDMNKCILCHRCIRACAEVQGRFVWGLDGRGFETQVVAGGGVDMLTARCESCGACAAYCPTGALEHRMGMGLGAPDRVVSTTCTYCGVGCTVDLHVKVGDDGSERVIRAGSSTEGAVNGMHLCVKGRYGYDFIHHPERLNKPRVREYLLKGQPRPAGDRGPWVEVEWETALDIAARKLGEIRDQHGPASVGVLTSAKCTNEENYLMNKLARQVIGTHNIDHCARL